VSWHYSSRYASGQNANYAGNITLMKWNVQGSSNVKIYGLLYDNLNRLKEGVYAEKNSGGSYTASGNYANALTYDRDGNILTPLVQVFRNPLALVFLTIMVCWFNVSDLNPLFPCL